MKICLIRNDKMGDMILTLPVVQGLKEANQDYKIDINILVIPGLNVKI